MQRIELQIADIAPSGSSSGAYALVLQEVEGTRRLPIVIGGTEAQAIAIELEKMTPSRPLTHDLFRSFAHTFNIEVDEVVIYNLVEGIFFAKIHASHNGKSVEIDARTSDAVAIAVRFNCSIFCHDFILDQAGVSAEEAEAGQEEEDESLVDLDELTEKADAGSLTLDELQRQLKNALDREDYEKASRLRDEIHKRESQ
jgi:bifunctional DNase/RNase